MVTTPTQPTAIEIWTVLKKEITGIQLLWETVNHLYFQSAGKEWRAFGADAPLLVHLTQTAMVESLLMRVSRMLDPAAKGRLTNLSLKQLVATAPSIDADEKTIRAIWDGSGLADVRNKYLSHNDLNRSMTVEHTLNIPLEPKDVEALGQLADGLRVLWRNVNFKLDLGPYVDQVLDAQSRQAVEVLEKSLQGGRLFFELLPDHPALQQALTVAEAVR